MKLTNKDIIGSAGYGVVYELRLNESIATVKDKAFKAGRVVYKLRVVGIALAWQICSVGTNLCGVVPVLQCY